MTTNPTSHRNFLPIAGFLLISSLGAGCAGSGGGDADTTGDMPNADQVERADGDAAHGGSHTGAGHEDATATGHEGHDHGAGSDGSAADAIDVWSRTYATPLEERTGTVQNLQGLRSTLVAELEMVRARLKDGARTPDERKADSTRAAELAQGLERLDRTIKQIDEADDVTWGQVRESNLKAAGDFRAWMAEYGMAS